MNLQILLLYFSMQTEAFLSQFAKTLEHPSVLLIPKFYLLLELLIGRKVLLLNNDMSLQFRSQSIIFISKFLLFLHNFLKFSFDFD
jgi:hypothetical protein